MRGDDLDETKGLGDFDHSQIFLHLDIFGSCLGGLFIYNNFIKNRQVTKTGLLDHVLNVVIDCLSSIVVFVLMQHAGTV